jgi:transcription initiation factor TFIID subunit TAF12
VFRLSCSSSIDVQQQQQQQQRRRRQQQQQQQQQQQVETVMFGFTVNHLNSLRMRASDHMTPVAPMRYRPLLSECASHLRNENFPRCVQLRLIFAITAKSPPELVN